MTIITIRQWHSYIGLFTAPSVLFFALTGAAQLFSLHEAHDDYQPPAIVEKLSAVHKDQVFALGDHHDAETVPEADAGPSAATAPADHDHDKPRPITLVLKGFFLVVALALALSSSLGIWMGLTQTRRKRTAWSLLSMGCLIPLVLLMA